jgi:hypothetical protein
MGILSIFRQIECDACAVRKEWHKDQDASIERQRFGYEARIAALEAQLEKTRNEVREYEQVVLRYSRLVPVSGDIQKPVTSNQPIRVGHVWDTRKAALEKEALDKAEYWRHKAGKDDEKDGTTNQPHQT